MKVPIASIVLDESLYPRTQRDWRTVARYKDALGCGAVLPPIVVGRRAGCFVLIDGWHRLEAARRLGWETVSAVLSRARPSEFFAEAVRLNAAHGRPLTIHERLIAAQRLIRDGYTVPRVAQLLSMDARRLGRLLSERVVPLSPSEVARDAVRVENASSEVVRNGTRVVLKAPLRWVRVVAPPDAVTSQRVLASTSQEALFEQVITLLETGLIEPALRPRVERLAQAVQRYLSGNAREDIGHAVVDSAEPN